MLDAFKKNIDLQYNSFKGKQIFVACSGGKDSMALTQLLLNLHLPFTLLHCNFKLRIPDCDKDEDFLRSFAKKNNVTFYSIQFETLLEAKKQRLSIQETARNLRYDWFKSFIQPENAVLLTAHHRDDNIETLFINLIRGTSLKGLSGMPENENKIIRPLLQFSQKDITDYVKKAGIDFCQDKSNFENKYLRNNLRNNILPQFEAVSQNFGTKIDQTITSLKEANNFLEKNAYLFVKENFKNESNQIKINRDKVNVLDPILLEYIFANFGIYRANRSEFLKFTRTKSGSFFYSKSHTFLINRENIIIIAKMNGPLTSDKYPISIASIPFHYKNKFIEISIKQATKYPSEFESNSHYLDSKFVKFPLILTKWKNGGKIIPFGMTGSKLISDILIDKKVSAFDKDQVMIICDAHDSIISVLGYASSNIARLTIETTNIIQISWDKTKP